MVEAPAHKVLIDGLKVLVERGDITKTEALGIIYEHRNDDPDDDNAVLWQLCKDWGLKPVEPIGGSDGS